MARFAPSAANACAIARPMPLLAPVTTTALPPSPKSISPPSASSSTSRPHHRLCPVHDDVDSIPDVRLRAFDDEQALAVRGDIVRSAGRVDEVGLKCRLRRCPLQLRRCPDLRGHPSISLAEKQFAALAPSRLDTAVR